MGMTAGSFDIKQMFSDIKGQPDWRTLAKRCVDYYDHEQLTPEDERELQRLGKPKIIENLIHAPVNTVLGQEAQKRRDWITRPDGDEFQEVAEAMNVKLNETMRLCNANQKCSQAYAEQIKAGIGWLHVKRSSFAMEASDYEIEHVHRDFMYWDMRDRSVDLHDCKWMARQQFLDPSDAKAFFPDKEHHALIDAVASNYSSMANWDFADGGFSAYEKRYQEWYSHTKNIEFLIDSQRKRVAIYEVYYRVIEKLPIVTFGDGRKAKFDKNDPVMMMAIMGKSASVEIVNVRRMRQCFYIGPHKIIDRYSPHPHDMFPYVPFYGYREDMRNFPYGIVRGMIDPQDAYNNANIRIHHILNQKRVIITDDSTDMSDSQIVDEVNRKDGVLRLKGGKSVKADVLVEQDWQELYKLNELKHEHAAMIREVAGVYQAYSGKSSEGQSGVAIESLAALGSVTMAEITDNYEFARKRLAELVLAYIVQDNKNRSFVVNVSEEIGQNKKEIHLNVLNNQGQLDNAVAQAKMQVVVAPVQSSAGYRQHQHRSLMEMYQASPDEMKSDIWTMVVDSSDWSKKEEYLKKWNEKNGNSGSDEEKAARAEQMMQQQQQEQDMVMAERQAELDYKSAQAVERKSEAARQEAMAAKLVAEVENMRFEQELREDEAKGKVLLDGRKTLVESELSALV